MHAHIRPATALGGQIAHGNPALYQRPRRISHALSPRPDLPAASRPEQDKYSEADLRLAEAQGWTQVSSTIGKHYWRDPATGDVAATMPRWTVSSEKAFDLMAEYDLMPVLSNDVHGAAYYHFEKYPGVIVLLSDHPNRPTALRYAIVLGAISALDRQNGI